jgi:hypothetical protein
MRPQLNAACRDSDRYWWYFAVSKLLPESCLIVLHKHNWTIQPTEGKAVHYLQKQGGFYLRNGFFGISCFRTKHSQFVGLQLRRLQSNFLLAIKIVQFKSKVDNWNKQLVVSKTIPFNTVNVNQFKEFYVGWKCQHFHRLLQVKDCRQRRMIDLSFT